MYSSAIVFFWLQQKHDKVLDLARCDRKSVVFVISTGIHIDEGTKSEKITCDEKMTNKA